MTGALDMDNALLSVNAAPAARWRPGRLVAGAALGLAGHVAALVGAMIAGRTDRVGDGFDDLAAVAMTFFGTQAVVGVLAVTACVLLLRRRRTDLAAGLLGGWLLGMAFCVLVISGLVPIS